jgi:hypothetical protein
MPSPRELNRRHAIVALLLIVIGVAAWRSTDRRDPARQVRSDLIKEQRIYGGEGAEPMSEGQASPKALPSSFEEKLLDPTGSPLPGQLRSALAAIGAEMDPERREQMLDRVVGWLMSNDPASAFRALDRETSTETFTEIRLRLVRRWAELDPKAAARWVMESSGRDREPMIGVVATAWANENLEDAIAWVNQMPDRDAKVGAQMSVGYELARGEPARALDFVRDLPASAKRDELLIHAAAQWASLDSDSAAAWAKEVGDEGLRERLEAAIATSASDANPVAAAEMALASISPGRAQADAVVGIVQRWAQADPQAAGAWVAQFPEGSVRNDALENLVKLWADQDPQYAGQWLNALGTSPGRDDAIRAYAEKIVTSSPAMAAVWANAIGDSGMREQQLESVAEVWLKIDRAAATAWISKTKFSPQTRARLLAIGTGSGGN